MASPQQWLGERASILRYTYDCMSYWMRVWAFHHIFL